MNNIVPRLEVQVLRSFAEQVFSAIGCSESDAQRASDVLITADLRGIDSHGVARLSGYVRLWEKGRLNTRPDIKIIRNTPSTATVDADQGLGLIAAPYAMDIAMEKAEQAGTGWVAVRNSNHFGIAAYHALKAVKKNMIGHALTNASPLVSPTFSKERLLGTNPICYAFPAGRYAPVVVDLATSAAANGKIEIAQRQNLALPSGWLQDRNGIGSIDPEELKKGGSLLPLGSERIRGSHKGYALSATVDLLSALLSGANYGPWAPPFVAYLEPDNNPVGMGLGHFLGAMKVDAFRPEEEFIEHMENWVQRFKSAERIDPETPVLVPGEPEEACEKERMIQGIPLVEAVIKDLNALANKFKMAKL